MVGVDRFLQGFKIRLIDQDHRILEDVQPLIRNGSGFISRQHHHKGGFFPLIIDKGVLWRLH